MPIKAPLPQFSNPRPGSSALCAREIAAGLHRGRKSGSGWIACCPSHPDDNPSLSLRDGDGGIVLIHCHAGCSQQDVIDALRAKGLWPQRGRQWLTRAEFDTQRRAARQDEKADEAWLPSTRAFLRELEDRRDDLIRLLRFKDDFQLEIELEAAYARIDAMRKAIGDDVPEEAVALTVAIVDLLAEKQADETTKG